MNRAAWASLDVGSSAFAGAQLPWERRPPWPVPDFGGMNETDRDGERGLPQTGNGDCCEHIAGPKKGRQPSTGVRSVALTTARVSTTTEPLVMVRR
jgi:hypothetical protein